MKTYINLLIVFQYDTHFTLYSSLFVFDGFTFKHFNYIGFTTHDFHNSLVRVSVYTAIDSFYDSGNDAVVSRIASFSYP